MKPIMRGVVLGVLILGTYWSCVIEEPSRPGWELDVVVPLIDERYYLLDLEGGIAGDSSNGFIDVDSSRFHIDSTLAMRLNVEDTIGTVQLDQDKLTISGFNPDPITQDIGSITLGDLFGSGQTKESETLSSISSAVSSAPDGSVIPVPSFTISPIADTLELADIDEAVMASGTMRISVYNGFIDGQGRGIPITNLVVLLSNRDAVEIGRAVFVRIGPDSTQSRNINLQNKRITNPIYNELSGESPGAPAFEINSTSRNARLRITTEFIGPFEVTSATANIPTQNFGETGSTPLSITGSTKLISGKFKQNMGNMTFTINNQLGTPLRAHLLLPNFIDDETELAHNVVWDSIPPYTIEERILSLAGDSLTNPVGNDPLSDLEFIFEGTTLQTGGFSTITSSDFVGIDIDVDTLKFKRIEAIFHETVPTTEVKIEQMPEGFDGINLEDVQLGMYIVNTVSVPTFLNLKIVGTNSVFSRSDTLFLRDAAIKYPPKFPLSAADTAETTLVLFKKDSTCVDSDCQPAEGSDIVDFFNLLPDEISVSGEAILLGEGVVEVGKSVGGWFEMRVPFILSLEEDAKFVPAMVNEIAALEGESRDYVDNNLIYAMIDARLQNRMALSGSVALLVADSKEKFNAHPDSLDVDTLLIMSLPDTDPELGIFSVVKEDSVLLDSAKIKLFSGGSKHWLKPLIILKSTNGEPRAVGPDDFVGIKSMITFRVNTNPDVSNE